jgi:hypothetical protein
MHAPGRTTGGVRPQRPAAQAALHGHRAAGILVPVLGTAAAGEGGHTRRKCSGARPITASSTRAAARLPGVSRGDVQGLPLGESGAQSQICGWL